MVLAVLLYNQQGAKSSHGIYFSHEETLGSRDRYQPSPLIAIGAAIDQFSLMDNRAGWLKFMMKGWWLRKLALGP